MTEDKRRDSQPDDVYHEAQVTERDRQQSRTFWGRYATLLFKRLLDAVREKPA